MFEVFDLGLIDFRKAEQLQMQVFSDVKECLLASALIICQHYPVITIGRLGSKKNILLSEEELKCKHIPVYQIQRGGDVTYHGPGQLNVYPIFNLNPVRDKTPKVSDGYLRQPVSNGVNRLKKDIHFFLRYLEDIVISALSNFGIQGLRYPGLTGVWVNPVRNTASSDMRNKISNGVNKQKIASIGIAIKNWITFHGLSINIKKDDLDNFSCIRPCGMNIEMTSLETILERDVEMDKIKEQLIHQFKEAAR